MIAEESNQRFVTRLTRRNDRIFGLSL